MEAGGGESSMKGDNKTRPGFLEDQTTGAMKAGPWRWPHGDGEGESESHSFCGHPCFLSEEGSSPPITWEEGHEGVLEV